MPISHFVIGTAFGSLIMIGVLELLDDERKKVSRGYQPDKDPQGEPPKSCTALTPPKKDVHSRIVDIEERRHEKFMAFLAGYELALDAGEKTFGSKEEFEGFLRLKFKEEVEE